MKSYLTNCVNSTEAKISKMVDKATEIDFKTLLQHVTQEELDEVFPFYKDVPNLSLESDYATSYYMSKYDGVPCVYVEHSRIEYIFV